MSVLDKLTEGIVNRDLQAEGAALMEKWEATGLLEGLGSENTKNGMALLLENQAKELLREASSMAGGDVEGFAAVAFPIVRRVFGGLIANDLVSVQPMSLPSGLIFFLDFEHNADSRLGLAVSADDDINSLHGGGRVGQQITGGVDLTGANSDLGHYNLNNGYSSPTGTVNIAVLAAAAAEGGDEGIVASGTFGGRLAGSDDDPDGVDTQHAFDKLCRFDPDFTSGSTQTLALVFFATDGTTAAELAGSNAFGLNASSANALSEVSYPISDNLNGSTAAASANAIGAVAAASPWGLEGEDAIPEIDIKVDSISVTAVTKKLKAKWTPELGQDLNAYHNLDAEVELTSILSEQIALEIDREILEDLVKGATADTKYWSRRPGRFLDRSTGKPISTLSNESLLGADFTGTVSEWYETLIETINDVSAQIHRKTLRGGANFLVCSPEVANILEFTAGFRANVTADSDRGTVGAVNTGSLSKKWDVYVDPYFPRNVVLVGRKGNSFLESGYVYAPYVPLQVTPTIFGVEDFVPRKGVMTRYAKKMVRPDMYGLVVVADLNG